MWATRGAHPLLPTAESINLTNPKHPVYHPHNGADAAAAVAPHGMLSRVAPCGSYFTFREKLVTPEISKPAPKTASHSTGDQIDAK